MLKPIWALKLDEELSITLVDLVRNELHRVCEGETHIYKDGYVKSIQNLASQLTLQMEENSISLVDDDLFLVTITVPEHERNYDIPPRTNFLFEGKPIGEIKSYEKSTGLVVIHVQDPAVIESITSGAMPQFSVVAGHAAVRG